MLIHAPSKKLVSSGVDIDSIESPKWKKFHRKKKESQQMVNAEE